MVVPLSLFAGLVLGFLAGSGVGGGTLLILWLTMVTGMDADIARVVNLLFFLTSAGAVTLYRWRKGSFDFPAVLPAVVAGCVTAGISSWLRSTVQSELTEKLFGILLLFTGLRELFYRDRKAK